MILEAPDPAAMEAVGACLARACRAGMLVGLRGELGAGKTTLVRGFLRALGHSAAVKSPTYTLVEPYTLTGRAVYHFDLYRVSGLDALEEMGLRDYLEPDAVCLVEWPERAEGMLQMLDLTVAIEVSMEGRRVHMTAANARGEAVLSGLRGDRLL